MGVPLDELINPAKVVNLERDLVNLRLSLASLTNINVSVEDADRIALRNLRSDEFDGGGGGDGSIEVRSDFRTACNSTRPCRRRSRSCRRRSG